MDMIKNTTGQWSNNNNNEHLHNALCQALS